MSGGLRDTNGRNGHLDLQIFTVRLFLWAAYAVWALAAPLFPRGEGSMPLVPLVVTAASAGLFLFRDRFSIDLLVLNSGIAITIVPVLLLLNVHRGFVGTFPTSWAEAPWHSGAATFLGFQVLTLFLSALYLRYTSRRWRGEPPERLRALKRRLFILVALVLAVAAASLSFVVLR